MSIYLNEDILLELKRNINGVEEDLGDETEQEDLQNENEDESNNEDDSNVNNENEDDTETDEYNINNEDESNVNNENEYESKHKYEDENNDEYSIENEEELGDEENDVEPESDDKYNIMDNESDNDNNTDDLHDVHDKNEDNNEYDGDNSDNNIDDDSNSVNNSSDVTDLEKEILGSLSDEQISIKYKELKTQYINIYSTIDTLLIRVNKISKNNNNIKVIEFILNKLTELKELVVFYLTNTFDTKSYIENTINYQQYLAILNSMTKLFKEINIKNEN